MIQKKEKEGVAASNETLMNKRWSKRGEEKKRRKKLL